VEWRVTMKTFFCEIVGDWITILVYKDGNIKCNHFIAHGSVTRKVKKGGDKQVITCEGPENCNLCASYKEDVFRREAVATQT